MARSILVIDDDIVTQNMLKLTLTQAGYSVITAGSGQEGIEKASLEHPGLIILDIIMPGMDGGEVAGFLQMDFETSRIPIIFLSSTIKENQTRPPGPKRTITYLAKPYDRDELLNEVRKHFEGDSV
jgi:two-component system, OmpR family, alkaline phosphatase synthesis response regulator PhoP